MADQGITVTFNSREPYCIVKSNFNSSVINVHPDKVVEIVQAICGNIVVPRGNVSTRNWLDLMMGSKRAFILNDSKIVLSVDFFESKMVEVHYMNITTRAMDSWEIEVPNLCMVALWNPDNGKHVRSNLYVVDSIPLSISTNNVKCAVFPFGNVYEDGHICWGSVSEVSTIEPVNSHKLFGLFFNSGFNGDLYRGWEVDYYTFISKHPDKYTKVNLNNSKLVNVIDYIAQGIRNGR